jgi:AraC-like DNA-binding protein
MQLKYKDLFAETDKLITQNNLHLNNEISVKIIAEKLNVAPLSISKAINFCTNDNFKTYINKKRIDFVKSSFEKDINKFTIQHIYTKAGFEQQSTFNRVFKEIVGQNPKEYILSIKDNKFK